MLTAKCGVGADCVHLSICYVCALLFCRVCVCLFACLFACLCVNVFVFCLFAHCLHTRDHWRRTYRLVIEGFLCLTVCSLVLFVWVSVRLFVCLSFVCLFVCLSVCLFVSLCCLFVFVFAFSFVFGCWLDCFIAWLCGACRCLFVCLRA